jgi:peptide deformylase
MSATKLAAMSDEQTIDAEVEPEEGTPSIAELDPETRARRDAALRHVRVFGDPVLRAMALPVDRFDAALASEIERMGELMHDALGVGLAATQLGILHRVLVYRADPEDPITALVNPHIEWFSPETELAEEGCLSLPGVHLEVERSAQVRVRARDVHGAELEVQAEGLQARVIQHEVDHLDGKLILDHVSRAQGGDARAARGAGRRRRGRRGRLKSRTGEACAPSSSAPPSSLRPFSSRSSPAGIDPCSS